MPWTLQWRSGGSGGGGGGGGGGNLVNYSLKRQCLMYEKVL